MKTFQLFFLLLLCACGKSVRFERPEDVKSIEKPIYWPSHKLPVKILVPAEKFAKYQEIFEEAEEEYTEAAGRPLIKFSPVDKNIQLKKFSESKNIKQFNYIMFKEDDKNFQDLIYPTMGITQLAWFTPSLQIYRAHIVINFSNGEMDISLFKEVLLHELGHFIGFDHVAEEDSIMTEFLDQNFSGLRDFDRQRIRKKYNRSQSMDLASH